jgi:outer membrane protein OmpA-like peptidoglycan-associated protein
MKFPLPAALSLLVAVHPLIPAQAQTSGMSLMGSVQSASHAPLPGAAVTVIHIPSGVRYAAAADASGHFAVPNLNVGGPYLIRVGEGGYRSQTVENIFLEKGKTTNFTVTLDRLSGSKKRDSQSAAENSAVALAPEATVGGPVLITTLNGQRPPAASSEASQSAPTTSDAEAAVSVTPATRSYRYPPRRPTTARVADPIVPGHYDAKTGNYVYDTGATTTLRLANGGAIAGVGANSTESNLYHFLSDPQLQVDTVDLTRGWYNFDRVYFEAGKATLTAASLSQLRNVATLLRAYPNARIKLGGYTDDTGTYKVNKALSEARARTAWASLVEMGVSPSRVDARGYGPNYSIASNATPEGRAMNRRLSVKVLQK